MAKCESCGSNVDLAKDSNMGHCADCNKIVEVKKEVGQQGGSDEKPKAGDTKPADEPKEEEVKK